MSKQIGRFRKQIQQGYFLEGDDGQPWPEKEWCWPCAQAVAFYYRRRRGMRGLSPYECWAGDDGPRRPQVLAWLEEAVASATPDPPPRALRDLLP